MILAVVGHRAVGVHHLQQIYVRGAQHRRGVGVELALDAHVVGRADDVLHTQLDAQTHRHGVQTPGKGLLQGNGVAGEALAGILGAPDGFRVVLRVVNGDAHTLVAALVAGTEPLVHGFGVDKELEGGAGLVHGRYLVVLPGVVVHIAHPGQHTAALGVHGNETAVHELHHIAQTVERAHLALYGLRLLVVEKLHLVGLVQMVVDGVGVAGIPFLKIFVDGQFLDKLLDEMGGHTAVFLAPGGVGAPIVVETVLHLLHLLANGYLGKLLDAGVERGVYLQTGGVEVVAVGLAPFLQIGFHRILKVAPLVVACYV